jgi:hypothetical protein
VAIERRIGIGHNLGPPLDVSWSAWLWRRAHAKAWKTPPREIAMLRIRRAERLGLSYRDYTAVLLDRGIHMDAIVFAPGALDPARPSIEVQERLAELGDCKLLLCRAADGPLHPSLRERMDAIVTIAAGQTELIVAIGGFLRAQRRPAGAAFLVGSEIWHERAAADAGLSLYKPAADYFSAKATR